MDYGFKGRLVIVVNSYVTICTDVRNEGVIEKKRLRGGIRILKIFEDKMITKNCWSKKCNSFMDIEIHKLY